VGRRGRIVRSRGVIIEERKPKNNFRKSLGRNLEKGERICTFANLFKEQGIVGKC
jgi:hypothetical protein